MISASLCLPPRTAFLGASVFSLVLALLWETISWVYYARIGGWSSVQNAAAIGNGVTFAFLALLSTFGIALSCRRKPAVRSVWWYRNLQAGLLVLEVTFTVLLIPAVLGTDWSHVVDNCIDTIREPRRRLDISARVVSQETALSICTRSVNSARHGLVAIRIIVQFFQFWSFAVTSQWFVSLRDVPKQSPTAVYISRVTFTKGDSDSPCSSVVDLSEEFNDKKDLKRLSV